MRVVSWLLIGGSLVALDVYVRAGGHRSTLLDVATGAFLTAVGVRFSSVRWKMILRRTEMPLIAGLDGTTRPVTLTERGAAAQHALEGHGRDLLARAPTDPKAARELSDLVINRIWDLERELKDSRLGASSSGLMPDVILAWETELAELKRMRQDVAHYIV